jgi:AraC-like DNA-binding protein
MTKPGNRFEEFVGLVARHAPQEGLNTFGLENCGTYKASTGNERKPVVDVAAIWVIAQGRKVCYAGEATYEYSAGNVVVLLYPMAVASAVVEASPESPFLVAGVAVDMARMADMALRIDRIDGAAARPAAVDPSSIFSLALDDSLLEPFIRLLQALDDPRDAAILGQSVIDEIYYRLLTGRRGGELRYLLQQRGEIQRISKAVEYIHANLDKPVSVEDLADMVYMSRTSFYENFRGVMQVSPLQYAKSVKLQRAQALIQEGKNAGEAGHLVGYNSPAQFSREYKRHFGYAPSATLAGA